MSSSSFVRSLITTVQQIICEVTRYPAHLVTPEADLEEDLGIDSVKLVEILAAIRTRYQIKERLVGNVNEVRTVSAIANQLAQRLGASKGLEPVAAAPPAGSADPGSLPGPVEPQLAEVIRVLAEVTRYPEQLLLPDVDLAEELGIELGKREDVLAALHKQLQLPAPLQADGASFRKIRTIFDLRDAVVRLRQRPAEPSRAVKVASPEPRPGSAPATAASAPLAGKIYLVTGSGRGLGKRLVQHLGSLGATVLVNSFHSREAGEQTTQELCRSGCRAFHVWGSVANPAHIERMFTFIEREVGGLDGIVSNAANGLVAPVKEIQLEHLELAFRTNAAALHLVAMRGAGLLQQRGGGRIVALSATSAHQYVEYQHAQGPAKAALEAMVRYLALELADRNVQVNGICAGPIYGEHLSKYPDTESLVPLWESRTPGNKLCSEQDIANVVEFLLSDKARMINGSIVKVDGGLSVRG